MKYKLHILFFCFYGQFAVGQIINTVESCQTEHWYPAMQNQKAFKQEMNYNQIDPIQVIISDSLPPISWWQSRKQIKNKPSYNLNEYHSFDRSKAQYNNQVLVCIVNKIDKPIIVVKPDRHLMLGLQAMNQKGEWEDVEVFFEGICGNSFSQSYNDTIKPGYEWLTFTELFSGNIKTKYRLKFLVQNPLLDMSRIYFYSNEVEGTINECRFIKRNHTVVKSNSDK